MEVSFGLHLVGFEKRWWLGNENEWDIGWMGSIFEMDW